MGSVNESGDKVDDRCEHDGTQKVGEQCLAERRVADGVRCKVRVRDLERHADGEGQVGKIHVPRRFFLVEVHAIAFPVVNGRVPQREERLHQEPGQRNAAQGQGNDLAYPIRGVYLDAISRAQDHIYITMAYFIPDQQILRALLAASRRGVDGRLILPEDSNHVLADWLSRGFYTSLFQDGITILLYRNALIHANTATIDGNWSTVGTATSTG